MDASRSMVKRWQRNSGTGWLTGSFELSDDESELDTVDDRRIRLLGDAAPTVCGFNKSSSEQVDTTVAPEHVGASSKRSPHSMVAGRTSPETSGTLKAKSSGSETRLELVLKLEEND